MDVTRYVVLGQTEGAWVEIARVAAASQEAAIRFAVDGFDKAGLTVAVPERSWKPVNVTVETRKQVTVAPAQSEEKQ